MAAAGFYVFNEAVANDAAERVGQAYVTVPDIQGSHKDTARRRIDESGLSYGESKPMPSTKIQRDYVMLQRPEPGSVVRAGRRVFVTLSEGQDSVIVPDVRGKTEEQARMAIEEATLTLSPATAHVPSSGAPGTVIGQDPLPGKKVARSSAVAILISKAGEAAPRLQVPNLVGMKLEDARARLAELGLSMVPVADSDTSAEVGVVLRQNPEYGKEIVEGGRVALNVRLDPRDTEVPLAQREYVDYTVPSGGGKREVHIVISNAFGDRSAAPGFPQEVPAGSRIRLPVVYSNTMTAEIFLDNELKKRIVYEEGKTPKETNF